MKTVRRLACLTAAAAACALVPITASAQTSNSTAAPPSATTPTPNPPAEQGPPAGEADVAPARPSFDSTLGTVLSRPGGITSDRVAERAAATSFDVRAREQDVVAAAVALDQALVAFFPRVSLTARYTRLSELPTPSFGTIVVDVDQQHPGPTGSPVAATDHLVSVPLSIPLLFDQTLFQASITVPISDYLFRATQAYAAATHSRHAAELTQRAAGAQAAFSGRIAWWNLVRGRLAVVVADQAVVQAQLHLDDVRHLEAAGSVSEADVLSVESQLASAQLAALRARDFAFVTEDQVRTAMHLPADQPIDVGDDVRTNLATLAGEDNFMGLYDEALSHRPELLALAQQVGSLREQVGVARAAGYPRIEAFGDALVANPNPRIFPPTAVFTPSWDVGVGFTWSPNDLGTALASTHGVEARAAQVEAQRQALRDQVRGEVMAAFTAVREADASIHTTATGLASAEEAYRVRRVLFQNGRATSIELTDAEQVLTSARLNSLNARVDVRMARTRLEHATGRDAVAR